MDRGFSCNIYLRILKKYFSLVQAKQSPRMCLSLKVLVHLWGDSFGLGGRWLLPSLLAG
jgi:hypothetical protein